MEDTPCFSQLLQAIDDADRELRTQQTEKNEEAGRAGMVRPGQPLNRAGWIVLLVLAALMVAWLAAH